MHFDGPSQTFNCGSDRLTRVAAEAKYKRRPRCRRKIQAAHRPGDDAVLAPGALDGYIRKTSPCEGHQMHPLVRRVDGQVGAEAASESRNQFVALIPV